jgi:proline racemase
VLRIQTLDTHIGGEPLRLIVSGFPEPPGAAVLERRESLRGNHDDLRTAILLEPRGTRTCTVPLPDTSRISGRRCRRPVHGQRNRRQPVKGRVVGEVSIGELPAIVPDIQGGRLPHRRAHVPYRT